MKMIMNKKVKCLYLLSISLLLVSLFVSGVMAETVIKVWTPKDPAIDNVDGRYMKQMINEFEELHPNIKIDLVPFGGEVIERNFAIAHYAGNPPDVVELRRHYLSTHVELGSIASLTELYEKWEDRPEFFQNFMDDVIFSGEVKAIPYFTDTVLFYYRKDLYEKYGLDVPKTWEELIENAKILTRDNMWGFGTITADNLVTPERWFYFLLAQKGQPLSPPIGGKATYDSEEGIKALQFYVDLANKYKVMPRDVATNMDDLFMGFTSGIYAQTALGTWQFFRLLDNPEFCKNVGIARLPLPEGGKEAIYAGGWAWAMSSLTKHKEEAWEFIKFLSGTHSQVQYCVQCGTIPVSCSASEDPALPEYATFVANYIKDAGISFPQHEYYPEFLSGLTEAIQKAIMEIETPEQALKEAAESFNQKYMD